MAELVALRVEIKCILESRDRHNPNTVLDLEPVAFETDELARIVRQRANLLQPDIEKYLRADPVVAKVRLEAELLICFDSIGPGVLELVRLKLVEKTNAAALLVEIHNDSLPLFGDHLHRRVELPPAVATE